MTGTTAGSTFGFTAPARHDAPQIIFAIEKVEEAKTSSYPIQPLTADAEEQVVAKATRSAQMRAMLVATHSEE